MIRLTLTLAALALSTPALACGGGDCKSGHCQMQKQDAVQTAMAEVDKAEGTKASFTVTGMTCGSCSNKLTAKLTEVDGVTAAAVSHAEGLAKVAFDADKTNADALIEAIVAAGFKAEKADQAES